MYMDDSVGYYKQCRSLPSELSAQNKTKRLLIGLRLVSFHVFNMIHDVGKKVLHPKSKTM